MTFENMKVGTRLGAGFGLVLTLLMAVAGLGLWSMSTIYAKVGEIVDVNVAKTALAQEMSESVHIVSRVTRTVVLLSDVAAIDAELAKVQAARAAYGKASLALDALPSTPAGVAARRPIAQLAEQTRALNDRVIALARANQDAEAVQLLLKEAAPATQRWQDAIDAYIERQKENNAEDVAEAQLAYERARNWMLAISALALVVAMTIAVRISRSLLRQLGGEPAVAADVASRIAAGDLTVQVDTHADDRHSMLFAMKTMRDALSTIVTEVRGGTEAIATASAQIASGNQDLSMRTEQQAGALEETASSMEELTSAVRQNNDHARHANQLAQSASAVAVQGGSVVAQVVDTMGDINASSRKIVDIIAVIDGIAFQTNILALNAAVEAARAGEQGRGFAVVASEVRTLAQRSASAAREIKELIGNSVEKVEQGSKLVEQAGATMGEVVASVRRVTDIMAEISGAGDEQSAGIEQINQAVSEMDSVTQQNAALVEEAAAAAAAMQQQAEQLERVVSVFRVDTQSVARPAAPERSRLGTPASVTQLQPRLAARAPQRTAVTQRARGGGAAASRAAVATDESWEQF